MALLTAYWTQQRLDQELSSADARLARQLDEETKRQAQQLRHERERAEVDDLRVVLGDALVAAYRARESIIETPDAAYGSELRERSALAIREAESQLGKMQVRIGKDDPISTSFALMSDCAISMHRIRAEDPHRPFALSDPTLVMWGTSYAEYVRLAQLRVGSRDRPG